MKISDSTVTVPSLMLTVYVVTPDSSLSAAVAGNGLRSVASKMNTRNADRMVLNFYTLSSKCERLLDVDLDVDGVQAGLFNALASNRCPPH